MKQITLTDEQYQALKGLLECELYEIGLSEEELAQVMSIRLA